MGNSPHRQVHIYVPPGYQTKRSDPYPVVFFLAGWPSRSWKMLTDESALSTPLQERFDQMIAQKKIPPFIGVFPDGTSKLGASQYINSPALGNFQDYLADELTEFIDSKYHTHRSADFRGITGHSSGGFGTLWMGLQRPDRFRLICSSAGDSFFEQSLLPFLSVTCTELKRAGGIQNFIRDFFDQPNPAGSGQKKIEALMTLSLAPCYAPNLKQPEILGDLFFEQENGKIIPEVWQKYLQWDPINAVEKYLENLKKLKWIHLDAGLYDEYGLQWGHRQFADKLKKNCISFQLDEYPAGHSGQNWRYEMRMEMMLKQMFR